jgi:hypothetical protein
MTKNSLQRAEGTWGEAYIYEPEEVFEISEPEAAISTPPASTSTSDEFLATPSIIASDFRSQQSWLAGSFLLPRQKLEAEGDQPLPSQGSKPSLASKAKNVTDNVSREELAARLETIEARNDVRFEKIMGEIRTSNATLAGKVDVIGARSAGKWTVWGAAGSIIVAMIATIIVLLQVMQSGYDSGRDSERSINDAVARATSPQQPAPTPPG